MDIIPCDAKNWEKWQQYLKENPKAADCTENTSQTDIAIGTLHHRHNLTPVSNDLSAKQHPYTCSKPIIPYSQ